MPKRSERAAASMDGSSMDRKSAVAMGNAAAAATAAMSNSAAMAMGNSVVVVAAAPAAQSKSKHPKYITWKRNSGALNNQLISVAAAFDTAKAMGRTVYIEADSTAMQADDPEPAIRWPKVTFCFLHFF
jgi:hypothetical protein